MTEYTIEIAEESATIGSAEELVVALDVLQGNHDRAVLEQLRPHLAALVDTPRRLQNLMRVLGPEDQLYLLEALGPALASALGRAAALRDLLATLAEPAVEEKVIAALGTDGLQQLLETPEQLAEALQWVYGHCDELVLDLLGAEFLRNLLEDGAELAIVLGSLETSTQQRLLEMLGWEHVLGVLHDERDLGHLMRELPATLSRRLLDELPAGQLRRIVRDERDVRATTPYLEAEELALLRARLGAADAQ